MTSYTKWKSWDASQFGLTSKENSLYYKKLFSRYLLEAKNVLEIGYGNGSFLNWCKEKKLNIHGVEQDKDLIARAKKLNYKVYNSISQIKELNIKRTDECNFLKQSILKQAFADELVKAA